MPRPTIATRCLLVMAPLSHGGLPDAYGRRLTPPSKPSTLRRSSAIPRAAGAIAMPEGRTIVYVSSAGSREILVLSLDRNSGRIEPIEATPVPGGEGPSPTSMPLAVSPDRRFVY